MISSSCCSHLHTLFNTKQSQTPLHPEFSFLSTHGDSEVNEVKLSSGCQEAAANEERESSKKDIIVSLTEPCSVCGDSSDGERQKNT